MRLPKVSLGELTRIDVMMRMTLGDIVRNVDFELEVGQVGAWSAPVAAIAQIAGHDEMYEGDPPNVCATAFEGLGTEWKDWKPSQTAFIPHYGTIAHFAHRLEKDWFEVGDIGAFRISVFIWIGQQVKLLRICQAGTASEEDQENAKKLLSVWADLLREAVRGKRGLVRTTA